MSRPWHTNLAALPAASGASAQRVSGHVAVLRAAEDVMPLTLPEPPTPAASCAAAPCDKRASTHLQVRQDGCDVAEVVPQPGIVVHPCVWYGI